MSSASVTRNCELQHDYRAVVVAFDPRAADLYRIFDAHNARYFDGALPELPLLVVQAFPYGHCIGQTVYGPVPRIEVGQRQWREGGEALADVLVHEMLHAYLRLRGEETRHNGTPWCREVERLTPLYLGRTVQAAPVRPRRIDGRVQRRPQDGHLNRKQLAGWPQAIR